MSNKIPRTRQCSIRLTQENYRAAKLVAKVSCRSLSELGEYAIQRFIEHNYPDAFKHGAVVASCIQDGPLDNEKILVGEVDAVIVHDSTDRKDK